MSARICRLLAVICVCAAVASGCSLRDDSVEPLIPPSGDLVGDVVGAGAVHRGDARVFPNLEISEVEPPVDLPEGLLAVGTGIQVAEQTEVDGAVEIRLDLPPAPNTDALPGALRVLDDGSMEMVPGLWDSETNQVVVHADAFSGWFGGWWNPLNWIEEAIDFAVDWVTGRTDPPECLSEGPFWSTYQRIELNQVHVCRQANLRDDGVERAEILLKSNRRTTQLIDLPQGAEYTWVEDQSDWLRDFLVGTIAGEDPESVVFLSGSKQMSIGFQRPDESVDLEVRSRMNGRILLLNVVTALLGAKLEDIQPLLPIAEQCLKSTGLDVLALDFTVNGVDAKSVLEETIKCFIQILQDPDLAASTLEAALDLAGLPAGSRSDIVSSARDSLKRIGPLVRKLLKWIEALSLTVTAWDLFKDSQAESRLAWRLRGVVPTNVDRPDLVGPIDITDAGPVHLLIDTSGSMDERPNGVLKIEQAKLATSDFLRSLESDREVGLRTYPAASGGNCGSGERLIDVGSGKDRADLTAEVFALRARGDTPTAEALRAAAMDLADYEQATIVLVSDGESTCDPPCQVAEQLVAEGFDVTVLAAGISIGDAGREELTCVANVTGGIYRDIEQIEDLGDFFLDVASVALDVQLDFDASMVAESAGDGRGATDVTATITNVGSEKRAEDILVRFGFEELGPAVVSPLRSVGNLDVGSSIEVSWSFRVGNALAGSTLPFQVIAGAENSDVEFVKKGSIDVTSAWSLEDAGDFLKSRPNVAILGDSYSAGEGTGTYIDGTNELDQNMCHRSGDTYLASTLGIPDENILACSGGVMADILKANPDNSVQSQVIQLQELQEAAGPVDAVVLTIGGNDVSFSGLAKECAIPTRDCSERVQGLPFDDFMKQQFGAPENSDNLAGRLARSYRNVNSFLNAPDMVNQRGEVAPILVLPYPRIVPFTSQACFRTFSDLIERRLFSFEELVSVNKFITRLNAEVEIAIELAAEEYDTPVFFVPPTEQAFLPSHTVCSDDTYVRTFESAALPFLLRYFSRQPTDEDLQAIIDSGRETFQELFHPNQAGYQAMTQAVLRWSNSEAAAAAELELLRLDRRRFEPSQDPSRNIASSGKSLPEGTVTQVPKDESFAVEHDGFLPFEQVTVGVASTYQVLRVGYADADGRFSTEVSLPSDLEPGRHTVSLRGYDEDLEFVSIEFPVDVPGPSRLVGYLLVIVALLFGLGWLFARRRFANLGAVTA